MATPQVSFCNLAKSFLPMSSPPAWTRISPSRNFSNPANFPPIFSKASAATISRLFRQGQSRLDALPNFKCFPGPGAHLRGAISISPSMEYMERAYDDAKYGHFSRKPYIDMVIPSLTDPSVAPPGKHVLSCFVQYAPYKLAEGTWDDQKEAFGENVINTIAEYAPNIKDIIIGRQVLTRSISSANSASRKGTFSRASFLSSSFSSSAPSPLGLLPHAIHNLYMCGSATHPGGGIMGANGRIASQVILKEWKGRSSRSTETASKAAH